LCGFDYFSGGKNARVGGSLPNVVVKVVAPVSKRFSSFGKQIENPEFAPVKDLLLDL
jgi:hypothetical protein